METTAADLLRGAQERLSDSRRWLHRSNAHAAMASGATCGPRDPRAARWDVYGAIQATGASVPDRTIEGALRLVARALGLPEASAFEAIMLWHDASERTHAEILDALERAARCGTEPLSRTALRALVAGTILALGDTAEPKSAPWWHYNFILRALGRETVVELVSLTLRGPIPATEACRKKRDGSPRTTGGAFFALARTRLSRSRWNHARWLADDCFKRSQAKATA